MNKLHERLKEVRIEKGLTQKQVAEAINVSFNAVSQYESGVREPSIDLLLQICNFLDVSADYIIGRTDEY